MRTGPGLVSTPLRACIHGARGPLLGSVAILGLSIAAAAHAQQNPGTDSPSSVATLEDIVVTAEKRSESLEKVPLSIVAYSAETLAETGVEDFSALAARIPGVTLNSAGPGQSSYSIRGIASVGGNSPTTGLYIDDTPILPSGRRRRHGEHRSRPVRSRPGRGAARTSGYAVRRKLHGRHRAIHHQPAEPQQGRGCREGGGFLHRTRQRQCPAGCDVQRTADRRSGGATGGGNVQELQWLHRPRRGRLGSESGRSGGIPGLPGLARPPERDRPQRQLRGDSTASARC